jgi:hypothetical protein
MIRTNSFLGDDVRKLENDPEQRRFYSADTAVLLDPTTSTLSASTRAINRKTVPSVMITGGIHRASAFIHCCLQLMNEGRCDTEMDISTAFDATLRSVLYVDHLMENPMLPFNQERSASIISAQEGLEGVSDESMISLVDYADGVEEGGKSAIGEIMQQYPLSSLTKKIRTREAKQSFLKFMSTSFQSSTVVSSKVVKLRYLFMYVFNVFFEYEKEVYQNCRNSEEVFQNGLSRKRYVFLKSIVKQLRKQYCFEKPAEFDTSCSSTIWGDDTEDASGSLHLSARSIYSKELNTVTLKWIDEVSNIPDEDEKELAAKFEETPPKLREVLQKLRYYKLPLSEGEDDEFVLFPPKSYNLLNLLKGTYGYEVFLPMIFQRRSSMMTKFEDLASRTENFTSFDRELSSSILSPIVTSITSRSKFVKFMGTSVIASTAWNQTSLPNIADKFRTSFYDDLANLMFDFSNVSDNYSYFCINCGESNEEDHQPLGRCEMCSTRYVHVGTKGCENAYHRGNLSSGCIILNIWIRSYTSLL